MNDLSKIQNVSENYIFNSKNCQNFIPKTDQNLKEYFEHAANRDKMNLKRKLYPINIDGDKEAKSNPTINIDQNIDKYQSWQQQFSQQMHNSNILKFSAPNSSNNYNFMGNKINWYGNEADPSSSTLISDEFPQFKVPKSLVIKPVISNQNSMSEKNMRKPVENYPKTNLYSFDASNQNIAPLQINFNEIGQSGSVQKSKMANTSKDNESMKFFLAILKTLKNFSFNFCNNSIFRSTNFNGPSKYHKCCKFGQSRE